VHPRAVHSLDCATPHATTTADKALGELQDAVTTAAGFEPSFCARHRLSPTVRQHEIDVDLIGRRHDGRAAKTTNAIRILLRQDVILVAVLPLGFAGRGEAKALLGATV
jgi:hypothetical protein